MTLQIILLAVSVVFNIATLFVVLYHKRPSIKDVPEPPVWKWNKVVFHEPVSLKEAFDKAETVDDFISNQK